ncbi:MAG: hypothetical protein ABIJ03_03095 [Patescibacteria group bacterium]|nr:hypothetical protein [Patescibacteria group bacterium]
MDNKPAINLQEALDRLLDKLEKEDITISQAREVAILLRKKITESQIGSNKINDE